MNLAAMNAKKVRLILIWVNVGIGVTALFVLLMAGSMVAYGKLYDGVFFPGARVLGVRLDGMKRSEASEAVSKAVDAALQKGLVFKYRGQEVVLPATTLGANADVSRDLISYDIERALDDAFRLGRRDGWFGNAVERMRLRVVPKAAETDVVVDRASITAGLQDLLKKELTPALDAKLVADTSVSPPRIGVEAERTGVTLVADAALDELERQARRLEFRPIDLSDRIMQPALSRSDVEPMASRAEDWLRRPTLSLIHEEDAFPVPTSTLAGWLSVTGTRGDLEVTFDPASFAEDVRTLAEGVEQEAKNGRLVITDGKIESFVSGTQGRTIDVDALRRDILDHWPASSTFALPVIVTQGSLEGEDPERLGIKELLGVGKSNFSGSPPNRRKNIALGAQKVNGTIIMPGEEFSLLTTLGPVDGAHNWLPELVIKGNETKPEYGGGLCQIGTTTFRGAISAGLPIVERRNHSYRVRYYEPAGTDATIYEPKPDFRFRNDTAHAVLINAYLKGDDAFFEFWGTKDGRKATYTGVKEVTSVDDLKPRIYNVTSPPPMKLIETLDLPPGKKKCTESAHAGADAEFTYTVTYPSGEVKEEVFRSHYRPWQAVCLIGVEKLSAPPDATTQEPAVN